MRTALGDMQDDFRDELQNALLQLQDGSNEALLGMLANAFSQMALLIGLSVNREHSCKVPIPASRASLF
jgi:hypothetical protein